MRFPNIRIVINSHLQGIWNYHRYHQVLRRFKLYTYQRLLFQIALLEVLKKLNIAPDIILGHSAGEVGCAYADGCLTLEEAVLVSYCRGLVSTSIATIKGKMAAVGRIYWDF